MIKMNLLIFYLIEEIIQNLKILNYLKNEKNIDENYGDEILDVFLSYFEQSIFLI
jgi:hypothetical protein